MRRLKLHPTEEPYGFDPGILFWSNLSNDIQQTGLADEYQVPPCLVAETKEQTLEWLCSIIKVRAEAYE